MGPNKTMLDERFSDSDAVATSWEDTRRVIEEAELFWLTTVRRDGRPHVTPVVAVWVAEALHFTTGSDEQKGVNLLGNSQVILTTGCNTWDSGLDVVVEGEAVVVTDSGVMKKLGEAWSTKWDGRWHFHEQEGRFLSEEGHEALAYSVAPTKVLAFAKGTFGHTVHRFGPTAT